jgi:hypothetical protein
MVFTGSVSTVPPVDDPAIENEDRLLRRIHPNHIVPDDIGGYRVSRAAFGDSQLSIDIHSILLAAGLNENECVRAYDGYGLVSITAGLARQQQQLVYKDPTPQNPAHGIVEGKKTGVVKKAFVGQCQWVIDTRPSSAD